MNRGGAPGTIRTSDPQIRSGRAVVRTYCSNWIIYDAVCVCVSECVKIDCLAPIRPCWRINTPIAPPIMNRRGKCSLEQSEAIAPQWKNAPATVGRPARLRPFSSTVASPGTYATVTAPPARRCRAGFGGSRVFDHNAAHPKTLEVGRFAHTLPQPIITAQMRRASWADSGADGCGGSYSSVSGHGRLERLWRGASLTPTEGIPSAQAGRKPHNSAAYGGAVRPFLL